MARRGFTGSGEEFPHRNPAGRGEPHPQTGERFEALWPDGRIDAPLARFRSPARARRGEHSTLAPRARRYVCRAPGSPPETVEFFRSLEHKDRPTPGEARILATQYLGRGRWSRTATDGDGIGEQGRPTTLTWSLVPDGTDAPDADDGPDGPSNLRTWLAGLYGGSPGGAPENQAWFGIVTDAFDALAAQTGIIFVYQPNDDGAALSQNHRGHNGGRFSRGDIRIAARNLDGSGGTLGFAYAPDFGDLVLDSGDSFFDSTANQSIRLFNVLAHEIGHTLGLDHVCPADRTKLMEPTISTAFRGPQFDEIYSLQRQYGDHLEISASDAIDNDGAGRATPLDLVEDTTGSPRWLSLDGGADVDYFRFTATADHELSARLIASDPFGGTYPEGAQNSDGSCTGGAPFDPRDRQNLALELLDSDGLTVLAAAASQAAGATETLATVRLPATGDYFLRVSGDGTDAAQLYELETTLVQATPMAELALGDFRLDAESNVPANGIADPGESVRLSFPLTNVGTLAATDLSPTLGGPDGLIVFADSGKIPSLEPGTVADWSATLALDGEFVCGDIVELTLGLAADDGFAESFAIPLSLGAPVELTLLDESFQASSGLPAEWSSRATGAGTPWSVVATNAASGDRAAFAASANDVGTSALVSPARTLGSAGGTLAFRHRYQLEEEFDGGVLEGSLDGGPWLDLVTHPLTTATGGYDDNLSGGFGSPIAGREAWTGNSGGFVTTEIGLPADWAGNDLRFRWLAASDQSFAETGWWLDSINFRTETLRCAAFRPALALRAEGATLSEGEPSTASLILETPLPLARPLTATLEFIGEADSGDLVGWTDPVLPAGQTRLILPLEAAADGTTEGDETLVVALPADADGFAAAEPVAAAFTIVEIAPDYAAWRAQFPGLDDGPGADSDADGAPDLIEYAFDTDPLDPADRALAAREFDASALRLRLPSAPPRSDLTITAETSADLVTWTSEGVTAADDGFAVVRDGTRKFLRLRVTLDAP